MGHVTVMFMFVDATLMGGVGWGGACYSHVHVTLMLR